MCRVIDVLAQTTVRVIDLLALLGYRCLGTCHLINKTSGILGFQKRRYLMRSKGNILMAFILLMAWSLGGFSCHGKYHPRTTEGIVGAVSVKLDIDPVKPIDGLDDRQVYPVKFVCGNFVPEIINDTIDPDGPLFPGLYLTAINIVNPIDGEGDAHRTYRRPKPYPGGKWTRDSWLSHSENAVAVSWARDGVGEKSNSNLAIILVNRAAPRHFHAYPVFQN